MRASKVCLDGLTKGCNRKAFCLKCVAANTTRSPVLSVSGRGHLKDAKLPEQREDNSKVEDLKQKLTDDLKQALRGRDKVRCSVIRLVMAAIKNAEIARQATLNDTDILGIIAKDVRQHQESIDAFRQGNRQDLVAQEEAELAVLKEYLPQQMTREEIIAAARQVIEEVGARGPGDKGKVMPKLIAQLKGRADGREINAVVTELLSS